MNSKSLTQKTAWSVLASFYNLFGRLVVQVMIARMLGPDGVGSIAYMVWLIEIANLLACLGLTSTLTRYVAEMYGQQKIAEANSFAQWVFILYFMLILVGSVAVGLLFFHSSQYAGLESALLPLILLFIARGLEAINRAYLAGCQKFDLLARVNAVTTLSLIMGVTIGAYRYGVAGSLYGYVAGSLFPAFYSLTILRRFSLRQKVAEKLLRRVWKFTFNSWLAMLVSAFVWSRMEIFFLERYWDIREVAMFTIALTFAVMVRQVSEMFTGAFMPHFSHLLGNGNQHNLVQRQYMIATQLMAFTVIPMAFGGAAIMPVLIPLLFGAEFASASPNAIVLTASSAMAFSQIGTSLIYAKERSGFIAMAGFAGTIMSFVAGFLIISRFGAWGAVWSRLFVQGSMIAIGTWFIVTQLHFSYPFRSIWRTSVASTCCALSAWGIINIIPNPVAALFISIPLGVVVYIFSVKLFHVLGQEEAEQLERLINHLPLSFQKFFCLTLNIMVNSK